MSAEISRPVPVMLPWFVRQQWVSDKAREAWAPVLTEFAECWRQLEWLTVVEGARPCASFFVSQQELAELASLLRAYGLGAITLSVSLCEERDQKQKILRYRAAIGRRKDLKEFAQAWKQGDDEAIGRLLGYPACCCSADASLGRQGVADGLWQRASQTSHSALDSRELEITSPPETNPFWRSVGLQLTPHHPCRFDCQASVALAGRFLDCGRNAGYAQTMEKALEILSWPVEWTSLHGIAEIRTPVVKLCQPARWTAERHCVRLRSDKYPELGARALQERLAGSSSKTATCS